MSVHKLFHLQLFFYKSNKNDFDCQNVRRSLIVIDRNFVVVLLSQQQLSFKIYRIDRWMVSFRETRSDNSTIRRYVTSKHTSIDRHYHYRIGLQ
jgi:hypothetical protein